MATATKSIYMNLNLVDIHPSKTNPRQTFEPTALAELAESIKSVGVLQAITVRKDGKGYEIIAGERRWRASKAAGLSSIPATVKEVDDKGALEIQVVENLQRADLHPLEEGEGYKLLIGKHGYQVNDLAAKVHKSRSYIFHRLALTKLSPKVKQAFLKDEVKPAWAEVIGRLESHKDQDEILEEIEPGYGNIADLAGLKTAVEERMLDLKKAPWNLQDAELVPKAGPCSTCPKRTASQGDLFGPSKKDFCLDGTCWATKATAHGKKLTEKYRAQGQEVLIGKKAEEVLRNSLHDNGELVKLDASPHWMEGNGALRAKLKGKEISTVLVIDQAGKPYEMVKTAEARAILKHDQKTGGNKKSPEQVAKREVELAHLKAHKRVCNETAMSIVQAFSKQSLTGHILRLVVNFELGRGSHDSVQAACQRLGLEPVPDKYKQKDWRGTLEKLVKGADDSSLKTVLAQLMIGKLDFPDYCDWTHFEEDPDHEDDYYSFDIQAELEKTFKTCHKAHLIAALKAADKEILEKQAKRNAGKPVAKRGKKGAALNDQDVPEIEKGEHEDEDEEA